MGDFLLQPRRQKNFSTKKKPMDGLDSKFRQSKISSGVGRYAAVFCRCRFDDRNEKTIKTPKF